MIISYLLQGDFESAIVQLFVLIFIFIFINPVHEFAHAFTAYKLGDNTPKYTGRLTLNPIASLDLYGALMLVLVGVGWAKPVQITSTNFKCKQKTGVVLTAAAGPLSNLLFAFLGAFILALVVKLTPAGNQSMRYVQLALYFLVHINVMLALFNLIPLPPLDGSRIAAGVLPDKIYFKIFSHEQVIRYALMGVMIAAVLLSKFGINLFAPLDGLAEIIADGFLKLTFMIFGMTY